MESRSEGDGGLSGYDITKPIKRSAIRNHVLGEMTNNARVIVVKPRDLKNWLALVERNITGIEEMLTRNGLAVENDETTKEGSNP